LHSTVVLDIQQNPVISRSAKAKKRQVNCVPLVSRSAGGEYIPLIPHSAWQVNYANVPIYIVSAIPGPSSAAP